MKKDLKINAEMKWHLYTAEPGNNELFGSYEHHQFWKYKYKD